MPPTDQKNESDAPYLSLRGVATAFIVFIGLIWLGFSQNISCLLIGLDGEAWRLTLQSQAENHLPFSQTGVDVLQGSFDAWYPTFREYLVPGALKLLLGNDTYETRGAVEFLYLAYASFLLLATYALGRAIGFARPISLIAAFLMVAVSFPALAGRQSEFYPLFNLNPNISQVVSLSLFVVASFWALRERAGIARMALMLVPAICAVVGVLGTAPYILLLAPAVALYGGASLLDAKHWRDDWSRLLAGAIAVAVPLALGMGHYLYSISRYTAFNYFGSEFAQTRGDLIYASTWFWLTNFNKPIILLGLIGAVLVFFFETGRLRLFAAVHVVSVLLFFAVAMSLVAFGERYHGPSPVYFETCFWPYTMLFVAAAIGRAANGLSRLVRAWRQREANLSRPPYNPTLLLSFFVAIIALFDAFSIQRSPHTCPPSFSPIRSTVITELLRNNIALMPGTSFKGLVATIDDAEGKPSVAWLDLHAHDYGLWQKTGNDHRIVGLWNYRIPTLFQYFSFITPPYYLLLTEFLARPQDQQIRSTFVLTKADAKMLQLWGVRYLISGQPNSDSKEVASLAVANQPALRLLEYPKPNLGQYSPINTIMTTDFRSGLAALHNQTFNGQRDVIVNQPVAENLVPANGARLVYQANGFQVEAESPGESILVLPIQFSHCWNAAGTGEPQLFRANLMQLGLRFRGRLDARLTFRFGPIWASACRLTDLNDMRTMNIANARDRGAR